MGGMRGAAKIAALVKIFRCITSARAASWGMMPKRISSPSARAVTEPDLFIANHNKANRQGDGTFENTDQI